MGKCFSSIVVKLCISSNALARLTLGATYNRNPSSGQYSCPTAAGASDICIFTCTGTAGASKTFNCENAGDCRFSCTEHKCAESATIYGDNANTLTLSVTSGGDQCFKGASVTAPTSGSLILNTMDDEKGYKDMTIDAGSQTQDIIIDCTYGVGEECKKMQIDARTAQYLEIRINSAVSELAGDEGKENLPVNIYCPENSNYNGPEEASCIIDITGGGTLHYANIYTDYGIPHDVWIKGSGSITSTTLHCNSGSQTSNFLSTSGTCWNTRNPTADPTISPTTNDPTLSPTPAPTSLPTVVPSKTPTEIPTSSPTSNPTSNPSISPTDTMISTTIPPISVSTAVIPSVSPTVLPGDNVSKNTKIDDDKGADDDDGKGKADDDNNKPILGDSDISIATLIAIAVIGIILCCLCFCIIVFIRKLRAEHEDDYITDDEIEMEEDKSPSQLHRQSKKKKDLVFVRNFFERDVNLPDYYDLFINNGYDSMKAILAIKSKEELKEIGVGMVGHQNLILTEITQIKELNKHATNTGDTDDIVKGLKEEGLDGDTTSETGTLTQDSYINNLFAYNALDQSGQNAQNVYYPQGQQNNYAPHMNFGGNMMRNVQQNYAFNNKNYMPQNVRFMMDIPPPPPEVNAPTIGGNNNNNPGAVGDLMNEMILRQKQRIKSIQRGEGSICTSYTHTAHDHNVIGTLETDDLFGNEESQRYIMPFEQDTKK